MKKLGLPNIKKFLYPLIATMTLWQQTYQAIIPFNIVFNNYISIVHIQEAQTLILQNSVYLLGCVIGTKIYMKIQNKSNKFIFLLSDILYFLSMFSIFFLVPQITEIENYISDIKSNKTIESKPPLVYFNLYLMFRLLTGISIGLNYFHSIIYLMRMTHKKERQFFFMFIPLFFIAGQGIGNQIQYYRCDSDSDSYSNCNSDSDSDSILFKSYLFFFVSNVIVVLRMILLQFLSIETPNYYIHKQQNKRAQKVYMFIHECQIEQFQQFYEKESKILKLEDQSNIQISNKFLKKYFKCFFLIVFTAFNGHSLIFVYFAKNSYLLTLTGILLILLQMIFFNYLRRKKILTIFGQLLLIIGIGFINSDQTKDFYIYLIQAGYCIGLGVQIYPIIGYEIPEFGIINCINIQWSAQLIEVCLIGWHLNRTNQTFILYQNVFEDFLTLFVWYFFISIIGFLLLFYILKSSPKIHPKSNSLQLIKSNIQQKLD